LASDFTIELANVFSIFLTRGRGPQTQPSKCAVTRAGALSTDFTTGLACPA